MKENRALVIIEFLSKKEQPQRFSIKAYKCYNATINQIKEQTKLKDL